MMTRIEKKLLKFLSNYVTDHKKALIKKVLKNRTRHITIALEDIYQSQNASAAVRTCDCFGIQDLHIIESKNTYEVNSKVVAGASKWVNIIKYSSSQQDNTKECINNLRSNGYEIVATSPNPEAISINDLAVDRKLALFFGTELSGLSDQVMEKADHLVKIPMFGFTESFNLSVSVAICLNLLTSKLFATDIDWALTKKEKRILKLNWYKKIINRSDLIEKEFLKSFTVE